jgi:uncharacterized protein (DUF983 family)
MTQGDTGPIVKKAWPAIWRGVKCRCPNCGEGKLFRGYLEQVEQCAVCGEPLAQYKAGLLLSFLVITIVIHVVAIVMLEMEINGSGNPMIYMMVLVPLSVIVPLIILRPVKGGIIGLFWAKGWSDEQDR